MPHFQPSPVAHIQRGKLITNGLVGAWPMNEGSGDVAYNVAGDEGRHGTFAGTGARWASNGNGWAASFAGSDDTIAIPNADGALSFESTGDFSLTLRLATATNATMMVVDNRITSADGFYLLLQSGDLSFVVEGTAVISATSAFTFDGLPHSIAAVCDADTGTYLYIDGVLVATGAAPGIPVVAVEQSVYVGSDGGAASWLTGTIADMRFYDRPLSFGEAARINAGLG